MGIAASRPLRKIFVTIQEGVAEVCEDTVPQGIDVEILDFDYLVLGDEIGRYFKHHQRNDLGSTDVTRTYGTKH